MHAKIVDLSIIQVSHEGKTSVAALSESAFGLCVSKAQLTRMCQELFGVVNIDIQEIAGLNKVVDGRSGDVLGALVDEKLIEENR